MKLQLALDTVAMEQAAEILDAVHECIDIVEVGTPWIIRDGLRSVSELKKRYPGLEVLADLKIMDAGLYEAGSAFAAGADIVTVMGVAHDETIAGAVQSAKEHDGAVMVDLLAAGDPAKRAMRMRELGADYVCVHTAFDVQASCDPLEELALVSKAVHSSCIGVAGGVKLETLAAIVGHRPAIVIVGGALTNLALPALRETATRMKEIIKHA